MLLLLGSLLLGLAAGYALSFRVGTKRAIVIGLMVCAGVFFVGLAIAEALRF